jgi:hypothetical protein
MTATSASVSSSVTSIAKSFEAIPVAMQPASAAMSSFMENMVTQAQEAVSQAQNMGAMLNDAVSGMFVGMGEALGNMFSGLTDGASAIKQFGNSILVALADFAGQLGKYIIGIGIAKLALDSAFKAGPAGAIAAIAAGTALVALSAAVKGLMSKGPSFSGGSSAGGGGYQAPRPGRLETGKKGPDTLHTKISGRDLMIILEKESSFTKRFGG